MPSDVRSVLRLARGLLLALGLAGFACANTREDPTGGETHFLARCDDNASACGSDLVCVCHVCTLPCSQAATCTRFPSATCASTPTGDACAEATPGYCEVGCTADDDCAALSASHVCVDGACRSVETAPTACEPSGVTSNEVVLLGDIFFAASHGITAFVEDAARQSGVLSAGERYRDFSGVTGNTLALLGNGLADQYAAAAAEGPVKVVIMTGGGADVLIGSCDVIAADCPLLVDAANAASALFERMANDGVEHIVYVFYPDPTDATLREEVETLRPLLQSACEGSPTACHWVDLRPAFAGNEATYLNKEGTTPTTAGAQASAAAIWSVMQQECIAQ
jgi:hypothetical protein